MKHQEVDLQEQMKEQCEDYQKLLREKMARDMEIAAYGWEQCSSFLEMRQTQSSIGTGWDIGQVYCSGIGKTVQFHVTDSHFVL